MYAVRRETSPCAGSSMNVVITNLFSGKSSSAPTSMSGCPCLMNGGQDREAEDGSGDDPADHAAEAERRGLEEFRAWVADELVLAGLRHCLVVGDRRSGRPGLGGHSPVVARCVPDPEERRRARSSDDADDQNGLAQNQADEDAGDANGEANRPDSRLRLVRGAVTAVWIHVLTRIQSVTEPPVNDVAIAATGAIVRRWPRRGSARCRTRPSGGRRASESRRS